MGLDQRAEKIKILILDIDGVLTDGTIGLNGTDEIKFFNVKDGHGIKLASRAGLKVGALSGRSAKANKQRAEELGFDFLLEDKKVKKDALMELISEKGVKPYECMYIGDDLVDIPVMRLVGVAVAVADAPSDLDEFCDFRTSLPGGRGAVREAIEWLLKKQGKWQEQIKRYIS